MSIRSQYLSGDDEEELFRLIAPDEHPDASDERIAKLEEESLASSHYDDDQEELDEQFAPSMIEDAVVDLSKDEVAEVLKLIDEIQNRRDSDD